MDARTPYTALVERLADETLEPHCGVLGAQHLPTLSREDLATVLAYEPTVVAEAAESRALASSLIESLRAESDCIARAACIGAAFQGSLHAQAKHFLLGDVLAELEARAERERQELDEEAREHGGFEESAEGRHGVAGMFR
ncbi:MAG TPA: hypothetical protein VFB37_09940 [Steroidobacteraceae bacterium]|nr:hypothetical protein [Steroidobacteraceae bacterium]